MTSAQFNIELYGGSSRTLGDKLAVFEGIYIVWSRVMYKLISVRETKHRCIALYRTVHVFPE